MPCWYYDKQQLRDTPSFRDGIDNETERRYRREGARFIMDTGAKMGLRYDTCATGVVYFNRFYMFHSLREFNRYVTGACCLFLAGKVEETPKKCKDIIKVSKGMLTEGQWKAFGDDPKEEVMTMERILLQTIKFDLMLEHPYAFLLKYAKLIKGDKVKVQKMVQMAWTFVNDSLCTTLCLQWEPEIIGVALMYLAGRLSKHEVTDWQGKEPGFKGKWYEYLIDDINLELLEDICHQVLDLYSAAPKSSEDSPPPPPPKPPGQPGAATPAGAAQGQLQKRSRSPVGERGRPKMAKTESHSRPSSPPQTKKDQAKPGRQGKNTYNPYVSSQMYSSSFMSQEGSQNIQSILGGGSAPPAPAPTGGQYPGYSQASYPPGTYPQGYQYPQGTYPPNTQYTGYTQPNTASQPQYQGAYPPTFTGQYHSSTPPSSQYQTYPSTTPTTTYPTQATGQPYQPPAGPQPPYHNTSQYPQGQTYPAQPPGSQPGQSYQASANPPTPQAYPASQGHPPQPQGHPPQPQGYQTPARTNTPSHPAARASATSHTPARATATSSHKPRQKSGGSNLTTVKISGR